MLDIWNQPSGYSFGIKEERVNLTLQLPVSGTPTGTTFRVISGSMPLGLRIVGTTITGVPEEVARDTTYTFCIRAQHSSGIADRTFNITVVGPDSPKFITPAGTLAMGTNDQYFVIDSSYVDFQLEAMDTDTAAGQRVSYFIASDGGELPPGLVLTSDGRITGFVQPALAITLKDGDGSFDSAYYDAVAYDFGYRPTNGYDSYIYDIVYYDFSLPSKPPKKLNRNYEFIVTITDGDTIVVRKFKIFVVTDDKFRADNITYEAGTGMFTADVQYLRAPIWTTSENLGTYRAGNYVSFILDTYEALTAGLVIYSMTDTEIAKLPPGVQFDPTTSEVFGVVPYQPAVIKTYSWTIVATRYGTNNDVVATSRTFTVNMIGEIDSVMTWNSPNDLGTIDANYISTLKVNASSTITDAIVIYTVTVGNLPPGLSLDLSGEIVGKVNQYGSIGNPGLITFDQTDFTLDATTTSFDRRYTFTVKSRDQYGYSASTKEFTISINTPNNRLYSNINVRPFLKIDQRKSWRGFINNSTVFTPTSIYRPNDPAFGVQQDLKMLVYAGIETKEAAAYVGAMGLNHKKKRFLFGNVLKGTAFIPGTYDAVYEVVYIEMIDPLEPRGKKLPKQINSLGNQKNVSLTIDNTVNFWDGRENLARLAEDRPYKERPDPLVTVDSQGYSISDINPGIYYPNSISNWRERLKDVGLSERNYLPLWMRSIQPGGKQELNYVHALPICYCKVGTADDVILNIKYSGFDFKSLEYTVDRYIIDSVEGYTQDKYLVFRNDRITV
jgi:hypothetical protein